MSVLCKKFVSFDTNKYESSTKDYHRFIPNIPQEFDCRVKVKFKPDVIKKDLSLKEDEYTTRYREAYNVPKAIHEDMYYKSPQYHSVHYLRTVQEKLFGDPPAPIVPRCSEMKDNYRMTYPRFDEPVVRPPRETAKCLLTRLGCEEQPAISPERKGFWRWLDPYLTTNNATYVKFCPAETGDIGEKIMTFYNSGEFDLPPGSGNQTMYDKVQFKHYLPNRLLSRGQPRVPNYGMKSEHQDQYVHQCFSNVYPYIHFGCTDCKVSQPEASNWQNLPAPGMYCSEYCHLGGKSVRCVVDPQKPKVKIRRSENCRKI